MSTVAAEEEEEEEVEVLQPVPATHVTRHQVTAGYLP